MFFRVKNLINASRLANGKRECIYEYIYMYMYFYPFIDGTSTQS